MHASEPHSIKDDTDSTTPESKWLGFCETFLEQRESCLNSNIFPQTFRPGQCVASKTCLCAGTAPTKCTANLTSSYRKNMAQWTYYLQKAFDFLINPYQWILALYKKTRACLQKMYVGLPQKHTDSLQKSSVPSSKLLTVQLYLCNRKQGILRLSAEVFQTWSIWCGKQCQTKKT